MSDAMRGNLRHNVSHTIPSQRQRQRTTRQTLAWLSAGGLRLDGAQNVQDVATAIARWTTRTVLLQADDPRPAFRLPALFPCIGVEYMDGSFGVVYRHDVPLEERDALIVSVLAQFTVDTLVGASLLTTCGEQIDNGFAAAAPWSALNQSDTVFLRPDAANALSTSRLHARQSSPQGVSACIERFVSLFWSHLATIG